MAGVKGRSGRKAGDQVVTDALRMAAKRLVEGDPLGRTYVLVAADMVVKAAAEGDLEAFKLMADRLEGRPRQALELGGEDGGPIEFIVRDLTREL